MRRVVLAIVLLSLLAGCTKSPSPAATSGSVSATPSGAGATPTTGGSSGGATPSPPASPTQSGGTPTPGATPSATPSASPSASPTPTGPPPDYRAFHDVSASFNLELPSSTDSRANPGASAPLNCVSFGSASGASILNATATATWSPDPSFAATQTIQLHYSSPNSTASKAGGSPLALAFDDKSIFAPLPAESSTFDASFSGGRLVIEPAPGTIQAPVRVPVHVVLAMHIVGDDIQTRARTCW